MFGCFAECLDLQNILQNEQVWNICGIVYTNICEVSIFLVEKKLNHRSVYQSR